MVYLIGAGPGDPGLITYKGLQILKSCDAVIYDRLGTGELLDLVRPDCAKIYVGKQAGAHYKKQEEINRILVETAGKYENVVRLKGGDSFVFGRGGEEILTLQEADIPFQVIPGVTSAIAVPEVLGIPVTHREMSRSFHVITGHTKKGEADALANIHKQEGTSVFLMGLSNLEPIMQRLREEGESEETPVSVISNGMLPGETIVRGTIGTIGKLVSKNELVSPAIIVVGQTAACTMKDKKRSAIDGCKIGVVGTAVFREKLRGLLEEKGASLFSICDMHVRTCPDMEKLDVAIQKLSDYRWIVFTSQNGIRLFFDRVRACAVDLRKFADIRFAVVGSGCAQALEQYGFYADYIPEQYTTESLANGICTVVKSGEKVLIPRAKEGSPVLEQILSANRIDAEILSIYDVRGARTENWKYLNNYDAILFASASGVHAFADCLAETGQPEWTPAQGKKRIVLGAIGQVTADGGDAAEIPFAGVFAVHTFEHRRGTRLRRQVDGTADIGHRGHDLQQAVAHILGMRGGEPHAQQRRDRRHAAHQLREIDVARTVGIDVLPQKCDFLVAFCHQVRHFVEDTFHVTAALASTGVGHDTVGTEIVTATHDRHESGDMIAADT
mgnify:CR=1 FL=1